MITPLLSYAGHGCPKCSRTCPPLRDSDFDSYFNGGVIECAHCQHKESAWQRLRRGLREEHPLAPGSIGLGIATASMGTIRISNGKSVEVDLSQLGVPPEARILSLTLTPQGGPDGLLVPASIQQHLTRAPIPHIQSLIGWPLVGGPETADVMALCVWLNPDFDPGLEPLVGAIESFSNKDYRAAIIPAMVAVEIKLKSVLVDHYSQFGRRDVNKFLTTTSLDPQLSFLLPSLMSLVNAPPLTGEVEQQLGALKTFRNKVAHTHAPMSNADTADALLGAIFGYRYLSLYGGRLAAGG